MPAGKITERQRMLVLGGVPLDRLLRRLAMIGDDDIDLAADRLADPRHFVGGGEAAACPVPSVNRLLTTTIGPVHAGDRLGDAVDEQASATSW